MRLLNLIYYRMLEGITEMKYDALEVARYILTYCLYKKSPFSNLKLQKLLYFVQGECYKRTGEPLFNNNVSAWQFGPVAPDVYYEYCVYAGTPILESYETAIDPKTRQMIDEVVEARRKTPMWKLADETHEPGTPWDTVYSTEGNKSVIPELLMQRYFIHCGI